MASTEQLRGWFESLAGERRAAEFALGDGRAAWTCAERLHVVRALYVGAVFSPAPGPFDRLRANGVQGEDEDEALMALLRGWTESVGPFTEAGLALTLGLSATLVRRGLAQLEAEGGVLRGRFTPGIAEEEFCNRRILARINRDTVAGLRQEVEPVPVATFIQFLFRWQHATSGTRVQGDGGLLQVVEQLQGFEAAAQVWETELLPLRMSAYDTSALDRLCLGGEAVWGRFARRPVDQELPGGRAALARTGPVSLGLREDLDWLLDPAPPDDAMPSGAAGEALAFLRARGASFISDIIAGTRRLPSEVEEALWQLAAAGLVTADGFGALRGLVTGAAKRVSASRRGRRRRVAGRAGAGGRCCRPSTRRKTALQSGRTNCCVGTASSSPKCWGASRWRRRGGRCCRCTGALKRGARFAAGGSWRASWGSSSRCRRPSRRCARCGGRSRRGRRWWCRRATR